MIPCLMISQKTMSIWVALYKSVVLVQLYDACQPPSCYASLPIASGVH